MPDDDGTEADREVEELAKDAADRNPEPTTRREAFELDLQEHDLSEEGAHVEVEEVAGEDG